MSPELKAKGSATGVSLNHDLLILHAVDSEVWVVDNESVRKSVQEYLKRNRERPITVSSDNKGKIVAFNMMGDGRVTEHESTTIYNGEIMVTSTSEIIQSI